jgi:hypothetical protein
MKASQIITAVRLILLIGLLLPSPSLAGNNEIVVFVHAGPKLNDPRIKQLLGALFEKGYLVRAPDDERDISGAGVDYFDPSAERTAREIAGLVNGQLKSLGLKSSTDMDLMPRFQRVNNPPTYFGIWLFGKDTR